MILAVGSTGRLGGDIAQELLAQRRAVRILLRHGSPAEELARQGMGTSPRALLAAGAEAVYGDLKDRASLDAACRGVEVVITTANSAHRAGGDNPTTVDLEGNRNLIDAAKAAGVRHFVFMSAQLANPESPAPFLQAKGKTEQYLQVSGLPYTILAPSAFMEVWVAMVVGGPALAGRPVVVVGSGDRKHSFISARDVTGFTVAVLDRDGAVNRKLVVGGPEALSFRDATRVFARVLGRDVPLQSVAPGEPIAHLPEFMWRLLPGFDLGDTAVDTTELAREFGVRLTSLEEFARAMVGSGGRVVGR